MERFLPENDQVYTFLVPEDTKRQRLDTFLTQQLPTYSRTYIKQLINQGYVTINDKKAKTSTLIKAHDTIVLNIPAPQPLYPLPPEQQEQLKKLDVPIIFENENFLVIGKPAGLMTHKPTTTHAELTLVDWLLQFFAELAEVGPIERPGIVHRLDKDTSGLMLVARNNATHKLLSDMFKDRLIQKKYLALVRGHPDKQGTIDLPIGRDPIKRNQMATDGINARKATTHYKVLEYFTDTSLLEVQPVTGRTHQIRVHLAALGYPIVGDELYGEPSKNIKRQALHAHSLTFTIGDKTYNFTLKPPQDFQKLLLKQSKI